MAFIDSRARKGGKHCTTEITIIRSTFGNVRFEYLSAEFYLTFPGGYRVKVSRNNMARLAGWIKMMMGEKDA